MLPWPRAAARDPPRCGADRPRTSPGRSECPHCSASADTSIPSAPVAGSLSAARLPCDLQLSILIHAQGIEEVAPALLDALAERRAVDRDGRKIVDPVVGPAGVDHE